MLLHGQAVPGDDLASFADRVLALASDSWPRAAALLPEGPAAEGLGRSWWQLPPNVDFENVGDWQPPDALIWRVVGTVKEALARCPRQPLLVLGGFSMGSVVATHALAALGSEGVGAAGLVVLSGLLDLVALGVATDYMPVNLKGDLRVFVSHGSGDQVIPQSVAQAAVSEVHEVADISARGVLVETHFHDGGHEIGDGTIQGVSRWLQAIAPVKPSASTAIRRDEKDTGSQRKRAGFSAMLAQHKPTSNATMDSVKIEEVDDEVEIQPSFQAGDVVQLRNLDSYPELNGARAELTFWDGNSRRWLVEVESGERVFAGSENLARCASAEDRRCEAKDDDQLSLTMAQLEEIRSIEIEDIYDHADLLRHIWGQPRVEIPAGSEHAELGGVPCAIFGRQPAVSRGTPTVLLFRGHTGAPGATFEQVAHSYVACLGAQVIVPFCTPKLSTCFASARAVAAALLKVFGPTPLLLHGANTGSVLAIQMAGELSSRGALPRAWLLVLDNAPPALSWIPGAQGMLGCMSGDPLQQQARLRFARCPVVLVRGFEGKLPDAAGSREPMDMLASCCVAPATRLARASVLAEDGSLCEEVRSAAVQAMECAEANGHRWVVEVACLAREDAGLKSAEVGRLQPGAVLEVLEQRGTRLLVQRLKGEGPSRGWISFSVSGRVTLRPED